MFHIVDSQRTVVGYAGLRMTADEFLALPESDDRYELVDGVVVTSPSPSNRHQKIVFEIAGQFRLFLRDHPIGEVSGDVDTKFGPHLVYRPDIFYLGPEKANRFPGKIPVAPDIAIEVVSPGSRPYDARTKRQDYEAGAVGEYWLVDPINETFTFLVLRDGKYSEVIVEGERYASTVLPGFELELPPIRRFFRSNWLEE